MSRVKELYRYTMQDHWSWVLSLVPAGFFTYILWSTYPYPWIDPLPIPLGLRVFEILFPLMLIAITPLFGVIISEQTFIVTEDALEWRMRFGIIAARVPFEMITGLNYGESKSVMSGKNLRFIDRKAQNALRIDYKFHNNPFMNLLATALNGGSGIVIAVQDAQKLEAGW